MKIISQKEVADARKRIDEFMRREFQACNEILAAEKKPPKERSELEKRLVKIPTTVGAGLFNTVEVIKRELNIKSGS